MLRLALLLVVATLAACGGGGEDDEIRPGPVTFGVVAASGDRERDVLRGAQVAGAAVNSFGGIGGAAPVRLALGDIPRLLARGVRLLILPCDQRVARQAVSALEGRSAVAVAPCDEGGIPVRANVFVSTLSPAAQADALAAEATEPVGVAPPTTRRGRLVSRLLAQRIRVGGARTTVGADAPETVRPPADAPEGTLYVTYGFPEPGSELDEFYERYRAMFGRRPQSVVAALAGDALEVLVTAVEEAASPEPRRVRDELQAGLEVGGILGELEFVGAQHAEAEWVALRVSGGRFAVVARGR